MIIELGHFAVILALITSLLQASLPLIGARKNILSLMMAGRAAAFTSFFLVVFGFFALMFSHVTDDFSVMNVVMYSHTQKPLLYKISGVWASHEGSMLLWVLILTGFGASLAKFVPEMPIILRAQALAVQGMIGFGFLGFILFTSNPFARVWPPLAEGHDLNPLLQDPGLAFHPPFLYIGYVGFSSVFALAAGLLLTRDADASWVKWLRPWALAAWSSLTFGIAMGSWWAYYELGWGGWWFWDPVENAALMPWLAGTALVHSLAATHQRLVFMRWTILLAVVAFSLSLLGTFLVRSGILTSVHTFAVDPARGVFVLALLALAVGGALTLYAWRAPALPESPIFAPISREGGILLNNLFLCTACATLVFGTLYPLLLNAFDGEIVSVGAPYFIATVIPLLMPVAALMVIGPLLQWHQGDLHQIFARLKYAIGISFLLALGAIYFVGFKSILGLVALALGIWVVIGTLVNFYDNRNNYITILPRLLAHGGLGVAIIGMAGSAFSVNYTLTMKPHQVNELGSYRIELAALDEIKGPNYQAERGMFHVWHNNEFIATMTPEQRFYPVQGSGVTDVAIETNLLRDVYLALGGEQEEADGTKVRSVRFNINPLVPWIWIGAAIMAMGGVCSVWLSLTRRAKP